jgi:peptidoglycan/xylan/chitin deacetylase (PgdA/CDA1 family)
MTWQANDGAKWIMKRAAKAAVAGALCAAGARWVVRSMARRTAGGGRVLILSYHLPTDAFEETAREVLPSLLVSTVTLRRQLEQLAREREIVSLDEVCRRLAAREPRRPRTPPTDVAAVTFDDGYAAVHGLALPVLRHLRIPATIYVSTGFVGTGRRLLHDRLYAVLSGLRRRWLLPQAAGLEPHLQRRLDATGDHGSTADVLNRLIGLASHGELEAIAAGLERRLGTSERDLPEATRIATWDELRALKAAGVDVGGHTVNHVALANVPAGRARAEIEGCRRDIAEHLGEAPRHFAYPNGYYTPRVRALVEESGFASAVTTEDVENRRTGELFTLKRKTIWENSTLGARHYSAALAACNLDGVFSAFGWHRGERGERPDNDGEEAEPERAAV